MPFSIFALTQQGCAGSQLLLQVDRQVGDPDPAEDAHHHQQDVEEDGGDGEQPAEGFASGLNGLADGDL